jgi:hypothetical protein
MRRRRSLLKGVERDGEQAFFGERRHGLVLIRA